MAKSSKSAAKRAPRKAAAKASSRKSAKQTSSKRAGTKKSATKRKSQTGANSGKSPRRITKALRLIFSYKGDEVKLVSKKPVRMTIPPSDPLEGYEDHEGFWVELKNAKKETLYRQIMHKPIKNDIEVFSDNPEQGISRVPMPDRAGVFVVVLPDTAKGHEVTLFRSPEPTTARKGGPRNLAMAKAQPRAGRPAEQFKSIKLKK